MLKMFEILLYLEIASLCNASSAYWAIFTIICIEKAFKFVIWCLSKD